MTPEQARAIYAAGEQAVIERLCGLDARVQAAQQEIEALQHKLARLAKDSSTFSKRPSSERLIRDVTFLSTLPDLPTRLGFGLLSRELLQHSLRQADLFRM